MVVKIAHRGDPGRIRENTLPSLASAIDAGGDWVEIDVKLTRDGVPVLLHDHTLERLWGVDRPIGAVTHAELDGVRGDDGLRIPTLREALELVVSRGVKVMVDIPGVAEARAAAREAHGLGCLAEVVFAGNLGGLADVRQHVPEAVIAMSWSTPRLPTPDLLHRIRPAYLNPRHLYASRRMIRKMRERGIALSVWTVDNPRRMAKLTAMGVDAIITNDIRALVGVAEGRPADRG